MSKKSNRVRRGFTAEFKQDAVNPVVKQGCSFEAAAEAVNVSSRSLREWHEHLAPEPEPCGDEASVAELRTENKRLRKRLQKAELEREVFNSATADFAKQSQ